MITHIGKETDNTRKEYYEYMSTVYEEISDFLRDRDGAVNPQKLELMFEKTASPYVYWNESRNAGKARDGMSDDKKTELLESLVKKYRLKIQGDNYLISERLETEDFKRLSGNMKLAGYRYEIKARAFVRDVK